MKSLRRSLNNAKDPVSGPPISPPVALPTVHKPSSAMLPPKKVIRALQPYRPQAPQELGFSKGDFFYVISEVSNGPGWYEAHNPVTGARGLVPKSCFEELQKTNAAARVLSPPAVPPAAPPVNRATVSGSLGGRVTQPRFQTFYAVVLHDFTAERADELDAKAGDPITVVAQSNQEWFVAKPIGKLSRPGLIPASFVELREPSTNLPLHDVPGLIARGELPKVEDWKRAMNEYKQSSISLGVLDEKASVSPITSQYPVKPQFPPMPQSAYGSFPQVTQPPPAPRAPSPVPVNRPPTPVSMQDPNVLPPGLIVSAEVIGFHFENDEYWFQINAVFQPDDPAAPARHLVLFRVYDDFYDFQVALLDAFPVEAGRQHAPPSPRSEGGPPEAEPTRILPYMPGPVSQVDDIVSALRREELDDYLNQLCALREINAEHVLRHQLVRSFFSPKLGDSENELPSSADVSPQPQGDDDSYRQALNSVAAMSLGPKTSSRLSDDSTGYDEYGQPQYKPEPYSQQHTRTESSASFGYQTNQSLSAHSQYDASWPGYNRTDYSETSVLSPRQGTSLNSPPISASNPQAAFVKIKIFHRQTDDLIAIRVSPRVTHSQLMEKVRERLGNDVQLVSYRSSVDGLFADLSDDYSLRDWLDRTDKHVLYAG